ncbi:hypothetical protein N9R79_09650 [Vibrio sp.]|nr:hypothetical protein [Vibrio sp.]
MAATLVLKVQVPASRPQALGAPIQDPTPSYQGPGPLPNGQPPPLFGRAIIVAGGQQSNGMVWSGCTYTTAEYSIPGFGTIEPMS